MMVGTLYVSPYMDSSGYGEASRNFLAAFHKVGANVKAEKVSYTGSQHYITKATQLCEEMALKKVDAKIKILHVTPDNYKNHVDLNKYNIGHLFWETDKLPKAWVEACNNMQEIWTGNRYGVQVIKDSGVTVPVKEFPEALDTADPAEVKPYALPNFTGTVFYSIFEWTERKNPKKLLYTFWKTFKGKNDVCLLLKVHKSTENDRGLRDILLEAKGWRNSLPWKDAPRVFIYSDILDEEGMNRFHTTGDVFVSAHRGEGWGLPQCEAALHLKPVISTGYGGIHEYWNRRDFLSVDFTMVPVDKQYNTYYEVGMNWAEASEESLSALMQKAYDYKTSTNKKGLLSKYAYGGRNKVQKFCSYGAVGKAMVARIEEIAKEQGWTE